MSKIEYGDMQNRTHTVVRKGNFWGGKIMSNPGFNPVAQSPRPPRTLSAQGLLDEVKREEPRRLRLR